MNQTGTFEGTIIGDGTKLRSEHFTSGGNATVLSSHNKNLIVKADEKWICDVADPAKLAQVGDVWIHVTHIGTIDVTDGWMAVKYHGGDIVRLTTDLPDVPEVPVDTVVVASVTFDFNAAHEIVAIWTNNSQEWKPYVPVEEPPVG